MLPNVRNMATRLSIISPYFNQFSLAGCCSGTSRPFSFSTSRSSIYSPEDLPPPPAPRYEPINIRIQGYDFTLVEHYMYYVSRMAHNVGVQSTKRWATPALSTRVSNFKLGSNVVENEYELDLYERNVELTGASAAVLSTLLDVLNSTLPEGVNVTAKLMEQADEDIRRVPDYELVALQSQLGSIDGPRKTKHNF